MDRRVIDRVTVTGADTSIEPAYLARLAEEYPFVEFGILLSKKQMGNKRFPSLRWMAELNEILYSSKIKLILSGHICGQWVRDMCFGENKFFQEYPFWQIFSRFQLNFHGEYHKMPFPGNFLWVISAYSRSRQFIFQIDGVNDSKFELAKRLGDMVVPLFDLSGGTGILPKNWPKADGYCGYAGGLSPENFGEEMKRIGEVAGGGPIWVDAETHLRSNRDLLFDLDKVRRFLEAAKPWVIEGDR